MGFRFRKSLSILPGVRITLGKGTGSVSFGIRGLRYTVGTRREHITAGLPGTGLSWTYKIGSAPARQTSRSGTRWFWITLVGLAIVVAIIMAN
jgi:Protein of unknown function (DUF4236)